MTTSDATSAARPLLLGEAPSKHGDPLRPLSGEPARKLAEWAALTAEPRNSYTELTRLFRVMNVFDSYEAAYPWSVPRARNRWARWLLSDRGPLVVVCLGRRAADTVDPDPRGMRPWGSWLRVGRLSMSLIPHPSGLNLLYNDRRMRDLAGRVLQEAISEARRVAA